MRVAASRSMLPSSGWPYPSEIAGGRQPKNRIVGGLVFARRLTSSASSRAMFAAPSIGAVTSNRNGVRL